jgi:hypothetical protein
MATLMHPWRSRGIAVIPLAKAKGCYPIPEHEANIHILTHTLREGLIISREKKMH